MKKLRAERNQKSYKRIDAYLRQIYKQNKDYLDEKVADIDFGALKDLSKEQIFYKVVKEIWKNKEFDETLGRRIKSYDEAIDKAQRSSLISKRTHYQELIFDELKKEKNSDAYHEIRRILKTRKFNPDFIDYVGDQNTSSGYEVWYEYKYTTYRKYAKIATRGKNKGQIITAKKKVEQSFNIIFHYSQKAGGGGWYEIIENPTPEMMKDLNLKK